MDRRVLTAFNGFKPINTGEYGLFEKGSLFLLKGRAVSAYEIHYHQERNHQGLDNRLIESDESAGEKAGEVSCRERLGGMLSYYYREAA